MRIPFLMLFLAILAPAATSSAAPVTSSPTSASTPSTTKAKIIPLPYGKDKVAEQINTFAGNLLKEVFKYKEFSCRSPKAFCFPIDTTTMDLPDLLAVKHLLKKLYGKSFDRLLQSNGEEKLKEESAVEAEMIDTRNKTLHQWIDILTQLEGKNVVDTWQIEWMEQGSKALIQRFVRVFDLKKIQEVQGRVRNVFGPALNKTVSSEILARAIKQYEDSELFPHYLSVRSSVLNDQGESHIVALKDKVARSVKEFVKSIFLNVFEIDANADEIYIGGFGKTFPDFDNFSLRTLLIFQLYLNGMYGIALTNVPVKSAPITAETEERSSIIENIHSMANVTVDLWTRNLNQIVHGNYSIDAERVKQQYEWECNYVGNFLKLEDLRVVHRNALSIFGGAFDAIKSASQPSGHLKKRQIETHDEDNKGAQSADGQEQNVEKSHNHNWQNSENGVGSEVFKETYSSAE